MNLAAADTSGLPLYLFASQLIAVGSICRTSPSVLPLCFLVGHITLDACLKRLGMWELFDNVWSCDDFNTTKADPQIYVLAAKRLNRSVEEVLFLDDNLNADLTAKAAGMQVCGVYDESSKDYVEQMKAATDYYIYDFSQLPQLECFQ